MSRPNNHNKKPANKNELNSHRQRPDDVESAADQPKKSMTGPFNRVANTADPLTHEFLNRRIVRICGPINDAVAAMTISAIQLLADISGEDIELRINSPGGSVTAGVAIYDFMKSIPNNIKTVCEGSCASMGAVLLAGGTPGMRHAMPNSRIMIHDVARGGSGHESRGEMRIALAEMDRLMEILMEILSENGPLSKAEMDALCARDHYLSPAEAKKIGLIDVIREPLHKPVAKKTATPDVSTLPPARQQLPGSPSIN